MPRPAIAIALLLALLAAACEPTRLGEVSHNRREIPPGPGVLTGEDGVWTIWQQ
jgi:hypothetical protein